MTGAGGRNDQPKMSLRVLLEGLGLGQYYRFFAQAGFGMIDQAHWSDLDVEDILNTVERKNGYTFAPKERILLWKALRLMWARGPGHDCPFIRASEVPGLFLPKRDWRQMDSDVKWKKVDPDRQRQVIRKQVVERKGKGLMEMQFEVYIRQQDIFYELKDIQSCVAAWMKSDPRKMLREDPREEAMKLRIRTMLDAAANFLQVRKAMLNSKRRWAIFFLLCRLALLAMSMLMFVTGYVRYGGAPRGLQMEFFLASGQFRAGSAFMLAFWVAFLVADRTKEDIQNKRFERIIIALERLMEEISSYRVETDHLRMEEHEAVQRNESAALTYEQMRQNKADGITGKDGKPKRRRKKKVDRELAQWAPGVNLGNMDEFVMKAQKAIEESYKRLPPLPDHFRRPGGDRMPKFEDKGLLGGVDEDIRHIKAPWQMVRGEARPTGIDIIPPEHRALPPPRRPPMPPPAGMGAGNVPYLDDLRYNAMGETPPMGQTPMGSEGWDRPPEFGLQGDEQPERLSMREAMRAASGSLPASRARTHSLGVGTPRRMPQSDATPPGTPPVTAAAGWPSAAASTEVMPEVPPLEPLVVEEPAPKPKPSAKAKRARRRGSKDLPDEMPPPEPEPSAEAAGSSDLRDAGAEGGPPPLPPSPEEP